MAAPLPSVSASPPARLEAPPAPQPLPDPPIAAPEPGHADLDPSNDAIVAPPDPIADCTERLEKSGVSFATAELPVRTQRDGSVCGSPQSVVYRGSGANIRWNGAPIVTCALAIGLERFERLAQEEALRAFGKRVERIEHGGTYSCRKMARFRMVSEHSYGNAIDIRSFKLEDGRRVSVEKHFDRVDREPEHVEGGFLRALARRLYDEDVFSVVLTRYFDELHRDHFHFDQARYRIDGTR